LVGVDWDLPLIGAAMAWVPEEKSEGFPWLRSSSGQVENIATALGQ
jgi:hypothetical protein